MTAADLGAAGLDDVAGVVAALPATAVHATVASDPPMSVAAARELIEAW